MIKEFFGSDEIKVALVAGFCVVAMAVILKRILHIEVDSLILNSPAYIVIIYFISKAAKKPAKPGSWILWSSIIVVFSMIAVMVHVL